MTLDYATVRFDGRAPLKLWTQGVPVEPKATIQLGETAQLPIVGPHIAVMPDVHWGIGSTVGSVVPTRGAIVPACVGVDIGCGMIAMGTSATSNVLGDSARDVFEAIAAAIPHGRSDNGGPTDIGSWCGNAPGHVLDAWTRLVQRYDAIVDKTPAVDVRERAINQLGTLGTGNHFIEVCLDEADHVWLMLHSGSRGVGNRIATVFIERAKRRALVDAVKLPNKDLAWLVEGSTDFDRYVEALAWAQDYAMANRLAMMRMALLAFQACVGPVTVGKLTVNCHHNYVNRETHFGEELWVTRKGAVSARKGQLGIIPGSMGAKSYIVAGLGNPESFESCSHGAGRRMSRGDARKRISLEQHAADTAGVVCKKGEDVIDESPAAYKDIDAVMRAQRSLVEVVHTLKQVVCVKG